ncbi:MAG: FGGY-family carbohydrate kinase [Jatrophihabitans sp.]
MTPDLLLGLDAGQTVIKAAVFDRDGAQLAVSTAHTPTASRHARWQERDMDVLWTAAATAIGEVVGLVGAQRIAAVGICGHGDGLHLVDERGEPVRAAVLATDSRAHNYAERLATSAGAAELMTLTGQQVSAFSAGPLLSWLRDHEPDVLRRARWMLFAKDWIRYRLTGEIGTDFTDASSTVFDIRARGWSPRALQLEGLAELSHLLPPVGASTEVIGAVLPGAAAATGLPTGTPVVRGAHDVDAAAAGMGAIADGATSVVMGTFSINQIVAGQPAVDPRWQARCFLTDDQWLHMSTSPSSASNLDWVLREFGPLDAAGEPDPVAAGRLAFGTSARHAPPVFVPLLFGGPFGDQVEAGFTGLRGWHTRADVLRAVFEGIVFTHRWHLDALAEQLPVRARPLRLGGGGSNSPAWSQLLADATGLVVEVTDSTQSGARGAALLAGVGVGSYRDLADATDAGTRVLRTHLPDSDRHGELSERYQRYLAAVTALRSLAPS